MAWFKSLFILVLALSLVGCATTRKDKETASTETQDLQMRINELERQLQQKDEEISSLEEDLEKVKSSSLKEEIDISKVSTTQIQTALKNAGFYTGTVDGKLGPKTKEAISEFQKANNLKVDGKVGRQTWSKLKSFLE
jgi:predicted RNase H-like nuclease (RuvC/YqgF family)